MRTCIAFCVLLAAAFATHGAEPSLAVRPPKLILKVIHYPVYPAEALTRHQGGTVIVSFMVDVNGIVHDVHVVESTPAGVFDASALAAVKSWVYKPPALEDGKPVAAHAQVKIRFVETSSSVPKLGASLNAPTLGVPNSAPPFVITHTSATFDTLIDHLKDRLASDP
jgi:TonB family protein